MPRRRQQPVAAPTGQTYGQRRQTEAAQRLIPLPGGTTEPPPPTADGGQPQQGGGDIEGLLAAIRANPDTAPPPGGIMNQPEDQLGAVPDIRPAQPLPAPNRDAIAMLPYLPALEALARSDRSTAGLRQVVRYLRSQVPPEVSVSDLVDAAVRAQGDEPEEETG